ncbi:FAD/NAD(P)-binding domain-containing protein [Apiospora marii]|uniref:FAD/NAD(P)-binding domain-containing protein n=2 Tax=Apiospora marii TaxID=335849 RepID=A0ABR1RG99_9PEZI
MKDGPFKVIIVGGGVAGLSLAHCLEKANIDYTILDKGVIAPEWGTSISIHPNGCRILDQLGVLEEAEKHCVPMERFYNRGPTGHPFDYDFFFQAVRSRTGYTTLTLERRKLLKSLYTTLKHKERIHEHSRVRQISEANGATKVTLEDGTEHEGDLVVGADGVHSLCRELMWKKANETIDGYISAAEKRTMKTTYVAIIACVPQMPGLGPNHMHSTSFDKVSFLMLCQPDTIYLAAHFKLPAAEQCRWPNRLRFTEADMEAYARQVADLPVSEKVLFGELWRNKTRAHIVSLEEGVLQHWHFGRLALLGDAIHKVTPNAGFGGSTAMEGAVNLTNSLKRALDAHPNKKPSDTELGEALEGYRAAHMPRATEIFWVSWLLTRLQAYDGWLMYLFQRWISPRFGLDFVGARVAESCCQAPQLDFVPYQQRKGTLPWAKTEIVTGRRAEKAKRLVDPGQKKGRYLDLKTLVYSTVLVCAVAWLSGFGATMQSSSLGARDFFNGTSVLAN